ncbi:MAG: 50S ribosomal protein L9 [Bacteroidota bacterium]|nr:50S ribosomal protein L9 [Bacteroidota bacterium]GIR58372.1 MAG: 50S ribosomal protein L9 [Crocinitomicaceae bacterium]
MDVLLKKDVERLGSKDEIVSVKNGYGRNYLIPKGLAVLATTSIKKMHAETEKQRALKNEKIREEATATLAKLTKKTFNVPAKVGENGKIFGSVTNVQVADLLTKEGFIVDRKNIKLLTDNIKSVGKYEAEITLYKDVKGKITFEVAEG